MQIVIEHFLDNIVVHAHGVFVLAASCGNCILANVSHASTYVWLHG